MLRTFVHRLSPVTALALALLSNTASAEVRRYAPEIVRAELKTLYEMLHASHYDLYAHRAREDYDAFYRRLRQDTDRVLTHAQLQSLLQRFTAYRNVAHAVIDPPVVAWEAFRAAGGRAFPLSLRVMDDPVWVSDHHGVEGISVGDRILAVDGMPALEWLGRLRAHLSADNEHFAYTLMEGRLPLLVWQEWGDAGTYSLLLDRGDGRSVEVEVAGWRRDDDPAPSPPDTPRFTPDANTREARMIDNTTAYLRPGPFYDNRPQAEHPWDPSAFHRFIDLAFQQFLERDAEQLLVDLRDNPGGNSSFSDHLLAWFATRPFRFSNDFTIRISEAAVTANRARLEAQGDGEDSISAQLAALYKGRAPGERVRYPIDWVKPREGRRFGGEVYVLVNRHSYSNAVSVAAIAQDYGFATVLGETTADLANTYGAMEHFTLPHSGIRVGFPKARILRPSGDVEADQVVPDVAINSPLESRTDVVLERALEIIKARR
jgi:predicted nucleic acid-binding protein